MEQSKIRTHSQLPLHLLNFCTYGIVAVFTSYLQLFYQSVGMNNLQIGMLIAAGPLVSLVAHPFWNFCRRQLSGIRGILLWLLIGILIFLHMLLWTDQIVHTVWNSLLLYFFFTPLLYTTLTMSMEYAEPTNLNQAFWTYRYSGTAGGALIPFAISFPTWNGENNRLSIIIILSIVIIISMGLAMMLPPLKRQISTPTISFREFRGAILNKYVVTLLLLGMLVTVPIMINQMFMPLIMINAGGTILDITLALCFSGILELLFLVLTVRYMKRTLNSLILGLLAVTPLIALRWSFMSSATMPIHIILTHLLNALTLGGFYLLATGLLSLLLPKAFRSAGQTLGILCWSGISCGIAGLLGGWMMQNFGVVILYKTLMGVTLVSTIGLALMWLQIHRNGYEPSK